MTDPRCPRRSTPAYPTIPQGSDSASNAKRRTVSRRRSGGECRPGVRRRRHQRLQPQKARPEYQRLLTDIQLGSRDGVPIWRLDRLHRQPRELEEFIVLCDKHAVALATVTGDVALAA